ncbi:hypothetical protein SAMN05421854_11577 [Amycolatopsis rubida]|uniref:Transcriptional regulator n=1 Tax=Amycolatopsis rubida TaxID=112413 RepID=A0A1I5ZGZ4_9PSEU|nr:hypothetical protein SAMN05421854_11577 [Amycolatopsis rubida]
MSAPGGRISNHALRKALDECRWNGPAFANEVNRIGREMGLDLHYARPSVSQWLGGVRPRPPVPEVIAEAISRRLGRRVTAEETGFGVPGPRRGGYDLGEERPGGPAWPPKSPVPYSLDALAAVPDLSGLGFGSARERGSALAARDVRSVATMTEMFACTVAQFGASPARKAMQSYIDTKLRPLLLRPAKPGVRWELLNTATRMVRVCGYAHYDDEAHGNAQCYYLLSASAAIAISDTDAVARVLRLLSMQARELGHAAPATRLARLALEHGRNSGTGMRALLHGQLSAAAATAADGKTADRHLRTAKKLAGEPDGRTWPGVLTGAYVSYYEAVTASHRGDRTRAITALAEGVRRCPADFARLRVIMLARLAELQAREGRLTAACRTWSQFLSQSEAFRSASIDTAVRRAKAILHPYRYHETAAEILAQIAHRHRHDRVLPETI